MILDCNDFFANSIFGILFKIINLEKILKTNQVKMSQYKEFIFSVTNIDKKKPI